MNKEDLILDSDLNGLIILPIPRTLAPIQATTVSLCRRGVGNTYFTSQAVRKSDNNSDGLSSLVVLGFFLGGAIIDEQAVLLLSRWKDCR